MDERNSHNLSIADDVAVRDTEFLVSSPEDDLEWCTDAKKHDNIIKWNFFGCVWFVIVCVLLGIVWYIIPVFNRTGEDDPHHLHDLSRQYN